MWKCKIHPAFENNSFLKIFLQPEICVEYNETLKTNEIEILNGNSTIKYQWKDIFSYFETYAIENWIKNYDYYYLQSALKDWERGNYDTLVVGSSYACFGYDDKMESEHTKNLALPSQDLYYALKIIEECKRRTQYSIKNIIIGLGYYSFYSDLSKTENEDELSRISNVYKPIFGDEHNAIILPPQMETKQSVIWNIPSILSYFSNQIYNTTFGEYFSVLHERKKWKTVMWDDNSKEWNELLAVEREEAGKKRAELHNKKNRYYESYIENTQLLSQLASCCEKNFVKLYICIFPVTKEYWNYIDKQMIDNFYNALSDIKGKIQVLDLNECKCWGIDDFNDMDHLSAVGAKKATTLINKAIGISAKL